MLKMIGDRTHPFGKPFFCFLHLLRSLSIIHRTSYWTAYSGLLYIVGCAELCCRVSVLRFSGSLCRKQIQIQIPFLTAQSTQIKSVISVPIKDFIHHYPRALFNDIPGSGRIFTTYPGRGAV